MTRPTRIHIHLDRLVHNCRLVRKLHPGPVLAVIKANAYGHGDVLCAKTLAPLVDGFAVASLEEACRLRDAEVQLPILLLAGVFDPSEMEMVLTHGLTPVVHASWQIDVLHNASVKSPMPVWLKVDTGMHRLGFLPEHVLPAFQSLSHGGKVGPVILMTHFANADTSDDALLQEPLRKFRHVLGQLPPVETSLSNSGVLLGHPGIQGDWARPGLMLFGVDPAAPGAATRQDLQPVMRLTSCVSAERTIDVGESVGYGSRFTAQRRTRVGVIPCGYADGYPRSAPEGTPIQVGNSLAPLIGRVSMDMLTVDLTDMPQAGIGTPVELWGDSVAVSTVAAASGTVAYEVLCQARRAAVQVHWAEDMP